MDNTSASRNSLFTPSMALQAWRSGRANAAVSAPHACRQFNLPQNSVCFAAALLRRVAARSVPAQKTNDAGEIGPAVAALDELLIDRGGARTERSGGARLARGGLR